MTKKISVFTAIAVILVLAGLGVGIYFMIDSSADSDSDKGDGLPTLRTPMYVLPTGLTSSYFALLSSIEFPISEYGEWTWDEPGHRISNRGYQEHYAIFTPIEYETYYSVTKKIEIYAERGILADNQIPANRFIDVSILQGLNFPIHTINFHPVIPNETVVDGVWAWEDQVSNVQMVVRTWHATHGAPENGFPRSGQHTGDLTLRNAIFTPKNENFYPAIVPMNLRAAFLPIGSTFGGTSTTTTTISNITPIGFQFTRRGTWNVNVGNVMLHGSVADLTNGVGRTLRPGFMNPIGGNGGMTSDRLAFLGNINHAWLQGDIQMRVHLRNGNIEIQLLRRTANNAITFNHYKWLTQ